MADSKLYQLNANAIDAQKFEARLDQAWSQIQSPGAEKRLRDLGLDPAEFQGKSREEFITIDRRSQAGFTGLETLAVNFSVGVALKLFEKFILPYIERGLSRDDVQEASKKPEKAQGASQSSRSQA